MCSSARGPAIEPSFVTCPIKNTGMLRVLASKSSWAATSRIWEIDPGADSISAEKVVWIESTMIAALFFSPSEIQVPDVRVLSVRKVSQVTGETDRQRNVPTDNQTESRVGLPKLVRVPRRATTRDPGAAWRVNEERFRCAT